MPATVRDATATDLRDNPAYTVAEAARYLKLAPATLRSWVLGRHYPTAGGDGHFRPLIRPASRQPPLLSFWNLIEAHVLRSLRTEHGVPVQALRQALAYAEKRLHLQRLLLRKELRTQNQHKAEALARLTGLGHAKVNHRLNQEVGIRKIGEATERELEARARAADRWIERLGPGRATI